ncbi:GlcG/HbpS family heme-binding protein [Phycicoccus avicenniae]|uniref:GlcG/HbpS family heme-binding protein n=1 Tax=Phycicoccus avicenniae TaxID=2828860 RepID=UPI003D2E172D
MPPTAPGDGGDPCVAVTAMAPARQRPGARPDEEHPMLVRTVPALTYAGARVALDAALVRAEELGVAVNVAVADASGAVLAFARMDGAFAASGDIARDKARTVTAFGGLSTADLHVAVAAEPSVREGITHRAGVAAFPGGVPVRVDGALVGAVGVSGGSAAEDSDVATAGATALASLVAAHTTAVPAHLQPVPREALP